MNPFTFTRPARPNPRSPQHVNLIHWWPITPSSYTPSVLVDAITGQVSSSALSVADAVTHSNEVGGAMSAVNPITAGKITPPQSGTLSFWLWWSGAGSETELMGINNNDFEIRLLSTGEIRHRLWNNASTDSSGTVDDSTWHHIACSWNADPNEQRIYIDGVLDTNDANYDTGTTSFGTYVDFFIGESTGALSAYDGWFADVRMYNRALTADEVAHLHNYTKRFDLFDEPSRYTIAVPVETTVTATADIVAGGHGAAEYSLAINAITAILAGNSVSSIRELDLPSSYTPVLSSGGRVSAQALLSILKAAYVASGSRIDAVRELSLERTGSVVSEGSRLAAVSQMIQEAAVAPVGLASGRLSASPRLEIQATAVVTVGTQSQAEAERNFQRTVALIASLNLSIDTGETVTISYSSLVTSGAIIHSAPRLEIQATADVVATSQAAGAINLSILASALLQAGASFLAERRLEIQATADLLAIQLVSGAVPSLGLTAAVFLVSQGQIVPENRMDIFSAIVLATGGRLPMQSLLSITAAVAMIASSRVVDEEAFLSITRTAELIAGGRLPADSLQSITAAMDMLAAGELSQAAATLQIFSAIQLIAGHRILPDVQKEWRGISLQTQVRPAVLHTRLRPTALQTQVRPTVLHTRESDLSND